MNKINLLKPYLSKKELKSLKEKLEGEEDTLFCIYQAYYDLTKTPKSSLTNLGWNSPSFNELKLSQEERENFLSAEMEVEEGIFTCICGSKKTFSYTKQTRSADESTTVFVKCSNCKNMWKES